jgi:hypothetical protein
MKFEKILTIMNHTASGYGEMPTPKSEYTAAQLTAQSALLDTVFPGFSLLSSAVYRYTAVDLSIYIPIFLGFGLTIFCTKYVSNWVWGMIESYLMSTADIRIDDEMVSTPRPHNIVAC